jgi:hypothetical protein
MGNSEDVFLVSVNVFTVPHRKTPKRLSSLFCSPDLAALKSLTNVIVTRYTPILRYLFGASTPPMSAILLVA